MEALVKRQSSQPTRWKGWCFCGPACFLTVVWCNVLKKFGWFLPSQVGIDDALSRRPGEVNVQTREWQAEFRSDCLYGVNIPFPRSSITQSIVKKSGSPARSNAVGGREGPGYGMEAREKVRCEACSSGKRAVEAHDITQYPQAGAAKRTKCKCQKDAEGSKEE